MSDDDVLVIGAGPTGLVLALWLTKLGVRVRILDKTAGPGTTSRALAVQARTLELYRQLDLADAVLARGHRVPAVNLWARGERAARLGFETIGAGLTPYSFMEIFPQDEHERLLIERLAACGVQVERRSELLGFREETDRVCARVRTAQGDEVQLSARYIAGCDGARSLVRETLGVGFPGGTYRQLFYVADIDGAGPPVNGELHIDLDEADFLAVFPLAGAGRAHRPELDDREWAPVQPGTALPEENGPALGDAESDRRPQQDRRKERHADERAEHVDRPLGDETETSGGSHGR